MKDKVLLAPSFSSYDPETFKSYVESLSEKPESKGASSVDGIGLTFGPRIIVRCSRDPKYVTDQEITELAKEYGKQKTELWMLFVSRKIEIRRTHDLKPRIPKTYGTKTKKRNAKRKTGKRKNLSTNKLL